MTILEAIRGKPGTKPAQMQAPDVQRKLRAAEAELSELEAQHDAAALDAVIGEAGAEDRLATLNRDLTRARDHVAMLRGAHKAAIERDQAIIRAQRFALRRTQMAAMRAHLVARDAAAAALRAAIEEATKQYRALLDRSAKAIAACPIGMSWPLGTDCEADPIRRLVTHELFRLSATPGNRDGRSLPGAELPSPQVEWQPQAITPLADKIKQGSDYAISILTGRAPE